jgi:hypothetical protein
MNPTQSTSEHGQNNDFETQLVEYVVTHRPKGDRLEISDKSFWIDAATEMAKQGIPTTADACESKWAEVLLLDQLTAHRATVLILDIIRSIIPS